MVLCIYHPTSSLLLHLPPLSSLYLLTAHFPSGNHHTFVCVHIFFFFITSRASYWNLSWLSSFPYRRLAYPKDCFTSVLGCSVLISNSKLFNLSSHLDSKSQGSENSSQNPKWPGSSLTCYNAFFSPPSLTDFHAY